MKRFAMLPVFGLLAITACRADAPTAPVAPVVEEVSVSAAPVAPSAALVDLGNALGDVTTRLLPGLEDQGAAEQLGSHLGALAANLESGNAADAQRALAQARAVLAAAGADSSDAVDLSFIELTLDQATILLEGSAEAVQ